MTTTHLLSLIMQNKVVKFKKMTDYWNPNNKMNKKQKIIIKF